MDKNSYDNVSGSGMNSGTKDDTEAVIRQLERMKSKFNNAARENQEMAQTVDSAVTLLRNNQTDASKLALKVEAGALEKAFISSKNSAVVFLIDGSGSMNGSPIKASLDAVSAAQLAAKQAKGATVSAVFFGDSFPVWIIENLSNPVIRKKLEGGLNSGTDLAPTVTELEKNAALNTLDKKSTHFVLLSDGDLFDRDIARMSLQRMLRQNRRVTLDVVIIGRHGWEMERLTRDLETEFPKQVKKHQVHVSTETGSTDLVKTVSAIASDRLSTRAPKKQHLPKPS